MLEHCIIAEDTYNMAKVKSGTGSQRGRKHAKNYIYEEAQKRLDDTVEPFNRQVENSLYVNAVEVDYYQVQWKVGKPCTCEKIEIQPEYKNTVSQSGDDSNSEPTIPTKEHDSSAGVGIKLRDENLFGDSEAEKLYGVREIDVSGIDDDMEIDNDIPEELIRDTGESSKEGDVEFAETNMYGSNANCGICYRQGLQPGYSAYGKKRYVITTWDIESLDGYMVATATHPNKILRQGPMDLDTYVEFALPIPKYFSKVVYSIRDNIEILKDKPYFNNRPLRLDDLRQNAGKTIPIRVHAKEFTHLFIEFDLGMDKLRANIGGEQQSLDYTKLEAISNMPVILPPNIHEVSVGDVLVIKDRKLVLKVIDKERKITADKRQLEWSVQTRLIQRTEPLRDIAKGMKLL